MRRSHIIRLGWGLAAAGLLLAGCSSDAVNIKPNSPSTVFAVPDWATFRSNAKASGPRPVTAADLVNADGQCAAADTTVATAPDETQSGTTETRGVGLEMTECQVVGRVGRPDHVEIGASPGGQRATVVTYLQGSRPGIYHFVDGRLKQIERAPEPPAPAKPEKPKKRVKPNTTANSG